MNIFLPMEIVNKILIMRPVHPIAEIIKEEIYHYDEYIDGDNDITFNEYICCLKYLLIQFNIRKIKNKRNNLECCGCNRTIINNDYYYKNSCPLYYCAKCF